MKTHFIFFYTFISLFLNGQSSIQSNNYNGSYKAIKWVYSPTSDGHNPKDNIGKSLIINDKKLILFTDTFNNVSYSIYKIKQIEFFRIYRRFNWKRELKIKEEPISILKIEGKDKKYILPLEIICTKNYLIVDYEGVFYYFGKVSN